ncbi:DUF6223 family protein [Myceligenerans halotolerans]
MSSAALAALTTAVDTAAPVYGLTAGRVGPTIAALVALAAAVIGGGAVARRREGRRGAIAAVVLGLVTMVSGAVFTATAGGGPGTGNGIVGSIAAVVLGLIACLLGGVVISRTRRDGA